MRQQHWLGEGVSQDLLFGDLKVLDVGTWIAAPVAATMLADFGAQVIKVELPEVGDGYRAFAASAGAPDDPVNFTWQMDARNKRSMTLNLKTEQGRRILEQLVASADVYITNHAPGAREAWGIDYDALREIKPDLIYASLTAYGEQGAERDREGFDLVAYWSRSGLMDLVRAPGSDPAPALPGMGDHPTAVSMYAGIVTALLRRERSGEGSYVHTSLLANGMWSASCIAQGAFTGADFTRYRAMAGHLFTRVMYETQDHRWLQFTMVRSADELDLMFAIMGVPELLVDPRFAEQTTRLQHGDELVALLRPVLLQRDAQGWLADFHAAGVPVALVARMEDLPEDPQVIANAMVMQDDTIGAGQLMRHPMNVEGLAWAPVQIAPEIGEHNRAILEELGYTPADIERLRSEGVI